MELKRKVRSDKKVDCKPTVEIDLKELIYRLSYILNLPVKKVIETVCISGLKSERVIGLLSEYFRRDLQLGNTFYIGDLENLSYKRIAKGKITERMSTRFIQSDYEKIRALAYALDVTPTRAVAILLEQTIYNTNIVNRLAKAYIRDQINESRLKELKNIIDNINRKSSHLEKISWGNLLSYFYDEFKNGSATMSKAIIHWIESIKQS